MRRVGLWTVGLIASVLAHVAVAVWIVLLLQPGEVDQQPRPESTLEVASQNLDRQTAPEEAAAADSAPEADRNEMALSGGIIPQSRASAAAPDAQPVTGSALPTLAAQGATSAATPLAAAAVDATPAPDSAPLAQPLRPAAPRPAQAATAQTAAPVRATPTSAPSQRAAESALPPGSTIIPARPSLDRLSSGRPQAVRPAALAANAVARPLSATPADIRPGDALPLTAARVTPAVVQQAVASAAAVPRPERASLAALPVTAAAAPATPAATPLAAASAAIPPTQAAVIAAPVARPAPATPVVAALQRPAAPAAPRAQPVPAAVPEQAPPRAPAPTLRPAAQSVAAAPPAAASIRATLAFPGTGSDVDPVSLAAFQSFVAPEATDSAAPSLRDALAGLLGSVPCSRLQVSFDPDTVTLRIDGHVPEGDAKAPILDALQARMGNDISVQDNMLVLPEPQCGVLAGVEATGLPQSTDQITNPLVVGEDAHARVFRFVGGQDFVLDATGPDYSAYVYVDYFDTGGNVLHLSPNHSVPLIKTLPKASFTLDPFVDSGEAFRLQIGAPYGQDIAVAFAASRPLYDEIRPIVEPAAPYLDWLRDRIAEARAADPDFKGEWIYFFVSTSAR